MTGLPRKRESIIIQSSANVNETKTLLKTIDVRNYSTVILFVNYTKGDESGINIYPEYSLTSDGDKYPLTDWSSDAAATATTKSYRITATSLRPITLDVRGMKFLSIYQDMYVSGPGAGTFEVNAELINV